MACGQPPTWERKLLLCACKYTARSKRQGTRASALRSLNLKPCEGILGGLVSPVGVPRIRGVREMGPGQAKHAHCVETLISQALKASRTNDQICATQGSKFSFGLFTTGPEQEESDNGAGERAAELQQSRHRYGPLEHSPKVAD